MTAETTGIDLHDVTDDLPWLQEAFRLGPLDAGAVQYLPDGMMNRNWRVCTGRASYALKRILDVPLTAARRNLRVQMMLAADDVPACMPHVSVDGDVVAEVGGRGYCLLPWVDGTHVPGLDLTLGQARRLGHLVGHIHQRLNSLPPESGLIRAAATPASKVIDPVAAIAEADRYLRLINSLDVRQPFDVIAAELLAQRKILIDTYGCQRPTSEVPTGPVGWTHGDLQHRNILWRSGEIAAVLDWDRIRVRPFAEEVTRTAAVQFASAAGPLDLERVAAFVAGYCRVVPLQPEDLADALNRLWWKRMSNFWELNYHYDRGDHGPDALFAPAERLLRWWTGRREEVLAAFTAVA
ncbi:phosphotransferase [Nonomuraea polychroma]|uniref:phosphotransferase n=1 Tax=Nonomuraea polychroma TaxID=46176 RepID=UPI003D8A2406